MNWKFAAALVTVLISGCSVFNKTETPPEPPTIASIEGKPLDLENTGAIDATRTQAIKSYREFLNSAEQNKYHAEAMRRIADLELEELENRIANYSEQNGQQAIQKEEYERVVKLYSTMLNSHPGYPGNDGVLYQLAKVHEQNGEIEKALTVFERLINEHPKSGYITEVQFRRGEILFVLQRYKEAYGAYEAVLANGKDTSFYERALYKHGWSAFKRIRFDDALISFSKLLDIKLGADNSADIESTIKNLSRGDNELLQDTLRVISLSFAYMEGPVSIKEFFASYGQRPYEYKVYRQLGELYIKQERIRDAADTYNTFVRNQPNHRAAPIFQTEVINAYKQGGFLSLTLKAKEEFAERYNKTTPYWASQSEEDQQRIAKQLQVHLQDLAKYYHAQTQKQKKPDTYKQATRWYRMYIESFPEDADTAQMNFLLAELLYESGDFLSAAKEYEKTAYNYQDHPRKSEAGYAAILANKAHEKTLSGTALAAFQQQSIESGIRFADTFPENKQTPSVLTAAADSLYKAGNLDRASVIAKRVIDYQPPTDRSLLTTAWTIVANTQFENQQFTDAEQSYRQVLNYLPSDSKQNKAIKERLIATVYKQGEQQRNAGNLREAVNHFLRVTALAPNSEIRVTAQYDAAASLMILEDWDQAANLLEDFRRRYPKHALSQTLPDKLAFIYLKSEQNEKAAGELQTIASQTTDVEKAKDARWQAAELYEKSAANKQAIKAYKTYLEKFPKPFDRAVEAHQRIATLYQKVGDKRNYNDWLKRLVAKDASGGSQRTTRSRYVAAKASYELAEPDYQQFSKLKLTIPLKRSLKKKKKAMQTALANYEKIAGYEVSEFTTAASYKIAEIYNRFGKDLMSSQRPKRLKADELEQYEILLEEQAFPFEEKSIDIHEINAARTAQGIYDEWVKKSLAVLKTFKPNQYNKPERSEVITNEIR
jgi:tetratricopeptide (TPR) repeat protein